MRIFIEKSKCKTEQKYEMQQISMLWNEINTLKPNSNITSEN